IHSFASIMLRFVSTMQTITRRQWNSRPGLPMSACAVLDIATRSGGSGRIGFEAGLETVSMSLRISSTKTIPMRRSSRWSLRRISEAKNKSLDGSCHAVFIVGRGDGPTGGPQFCGSIAHHDGLTGIREHVEIT